MRGELFTFAPPNLVAFLSNGSAAATDVKSAVVLIGGLTDGLLPTPYVKVLGESLAEVGVSLVQFLMTSSYRGYGTSSLDQDACELALLLDHLVREREIKNVLLLGHSTGCQDILWYFQRGHYRKEHCIRAAALQAPVSDRDYFFGLEPKLAEEALAWAEERCLAGRSAELYPTLWHGVPITAYRLKSLLSINGDDDFFSIHLSDLERAAKFSSLSAPIYVFWSANDETVPDPSIYAQLADSFTKASPFIRIEPVMPEASHNLCSRRSTDRFIERIIGLVKEHFN